MSYIRMDPNLFASCCPGDTLHLQGSQVCNKPCSFSSLNPMFLSRYSTSPAEFNTYTDAWFVVIKFICRSRRPLDAGLKLVHQIPPGSSYRSLAFSFLVPHNTISLFGPDCVRLSMTSPRRALQTALNGRQVKVRGGRQVQLRWNFHHTCGAIDGKHVAIVKPRGSGYSTSTIKASA